MDPGRTGRFVRGNLEIIPLPGRTLGRDQPLYIYFEIYNLEKDGFGATRYQVEYSLSESASDDGSLRRLFQGLGAMVGLPGEKPAIQSSAFLHEGVDRDAVLSSED